MPQSSFGKESQDDHHEEEPCSSRKNNPIVIPKAYPSIVHKPDCGSEKDRELTPGSQAGRYKRFDKCITKDAELVFIPTDDDIIFGRGKGSHDHPGNKRMRDIIRRYKKEYSETRRSKKREVAEVVYSEITLNGARFLHKTEGEDAYAIVTLDLALQKLSNTLRCRSSCLTLGEGGAIAASAPVTLPYEAQLPAHLSYESAAARATGRISLLLSSSPFALLPPAHLSVPPFGLASLLASDTIYQHRGHHVEPPSNIAEKPFVVQKAVVVNQYKADYSREKERRQMRPPVSQVGNYKRFETSIPKDAELVLIPTQQDVVFGRGKGSHDRPGNLRMRAIIRSHKNEYAEARKSKKREIAELVYSEITQDGARFLYQNQEKNAYAIVTLNLALQKLSNTLRCRKSCI